MTPPTGITDPEGKGRSLLLRRTIYGTKQAAREWHSLLKSVLIELGYKAVDASDCFWLLRSGKSISMLVIHVDDIAHAHNDAKMSATLKGKCKDLWGLSGDGPLEWFLGMRVDYIKGVSTSISQKAYLEAVLKRFDMEAVHPRKTPMETSLKISTADCPAQMNDLVRQQYQSILGSLMYAATMTRPDLANACAQFGRVMANPSEAHLAALKRIVRYVAGTLDLCLKFTNEPWTPPGYERPVEPLTPVAFSDSDWASNVDDRSSTTGSLVFLCGAPISWRSRSQKIKALSSAEAEYVAMGETSKDVAYVRNVLRELGMGDIKGPTSISTDSTSAMAIAKQVGVRDKTKHIELRYHYIRGLIDRGEIDLIKVDTKLNPADALTKALPIDPFELHRDVMLRRADA